MGWDLRKVQIRPTRHDHHLSLDGPHGGLEVAVEGFLKGDIAGLPGVEHDEEVFGI